MALITRVSRLFRADLHAVLDRIEEPDVLLRQSVREMEAALDAERREAESTRHERARLERRRGELGAQLEDIERELDLCFASQREDLARGLVRRKLVAERAARLVDERVDSVGRALAALDARIAEHRDRLEALREKADLLAEPAPADRHEPAGVEPGTDAGIREADVEIALLREKQRRAST